MTSILNFLPAGSFKHKGGGEWAGPCPRCGGEDRFVTWPEHPSDAIGGKYLCRGCAAEGGDGIQFLRDFMGMSFQDACRELGTDMSEQKNVRQEKPAVVWTPKEERLPSAGWQRRGLAFLAECTAHIESGLGREYLEKRFLSIETARRFRIGWNPADRYEVPEAWAIDPWFNSKGNLGKLYLPAGLVLPVFRKEGLAAIKIRRRDWVKGDSWPKYHAVKAGGNAFLVLGKPGLSVVVVESEIDAFLIAQDAASLCSVVALGSAGNKPDTKTAAFLRQSPQILFALDFDEAGMRPWSWWKENFPAVTAWPPAEGKDIGDMVAAGILPAMWLQAALKPPAPAPIPISRTWDDLCPDYWRGCFKCPDMNFDSVTFCRRYSLAG